MDSASAPSVPGRIGIHCALQRSTVSVRRGSMTTMSAPRDAADSRRRMSSGGESVAGLVPHTSAISVFSMSLYMSTSIRPMVTWGAMMANET